MPISVSCDSSAVGKFDTRGNAIPHLSILLFILAAALGWGYYLDRFNLLYSTTGVVYGVGYTAAHVTLIALWIMIGVSAAACALLVLNFFRPRWKALAIGLGVYAALYVLGVLLVPALFQKFRGAAERARAGNSLFESLHRLHSKGIQAGRHPGEILPGDGGSDARGDCEESRHHSKHPSLGCPPAASDLSADASHTSLLPVLQRGRGSLPSGGWLSPGDAFDPRAIGGTPCQSANLGEPKPAIHAWRGRRHELCLKNHAGRVSRVSYRQRAARIHGHGPENCSAGHLLWRGDSGFQDRRHGRQGI